MTEAADALRPEDRTWAAAARSGRLVARHRMVQDRRAEVERTVGLAKWRTMRREPVEAVLVEAQARFHAKAVGVYERLLTGISNDVLPSRIGIELELGSQRGRPSLDIVARRAEGPVNVSRASGGSVRNVLSMGLRAAAVVKSGQRRFMALDEPDCWIEVAHVPAYARVLSTLSRDLGLQTLLVSHHSPALFAGAYVVRLDGTPETGITAVTEAAPPAGDGDSIASIRLVDFLSHADTAIPLAPGLTCLVGGNDVGKSAVVNALRAISQGDIRNEDIRHGASCASVEVTLRDGRSARVARSDKRHVKLAWSMTAADGTVSTSEGSEPPDFVTDLLRMRPHGDMEIHVSRQDHPNFLIDEVASRRAEILSIGEEASHLDARMERWARIQREDAGTIRTGEAEASRLDAQLAVLDPVVAVDDRVAAMTRGFPAMAAARTDAEAMGAALGQAEACASAAARARGVAATLAATPAPPGLTDAAALGDLLAELADAAARRALADDVVAATAFVGDPPTLADPWGVRDAATAVAAAAAAVAATRRRGAALEALAGAPPPIAAPDAADAATAIEAASAASGRSRAAIAACASPGDPPALADLGGPAEVAALLAALTGSLAEARSGLACAEAEIFECEADIGSWSLETGGSCPTCGRDGFDPLSGLHLHEADR